MKKYILFEHASGYAIFKIIANEEVGVLVDQVQESISQLDRFGKLVKLFAFYQFPSAQIALENAKNIVNGDVTEELLQFLTSNIKVSSKIQLGVSDSKLAGNIVEKSGINCINNDVISEISRGLRMHFTKMVSEDLRNSVSSSVIGLGHNLSRDKIKFNANKCDNMIIQSVAMIEFLDKDINTFSQRIREWYSYHFPELYPIVKDNVLFAKAAFLIGNRANISDEILEKLAELVGSENAQKIYEVSQQSIGMDIMDIDLVNIKDFCLKIIDLAEYRDSLMEYMSGKMNLIAPNLSSVIGEMVGAKLISQAGSLINLAKCPSSTVQILGAEKSLFRALKTRGKTPKYGIIYHSSFIGRSPLKYKGRVSRFLAHKCSIACRIDSFSDNPNPIIGKKLHEHIEERLQYFKNNEPEDEDQIPRSNAVVMQEALDELKEYNLNQVKSSKKVKKVKKAKTVKRLKYI